MALKEAKRWHQTPKNRILLEDDLLPGDLEAHIVAFVGHYNHQRYHESLSNFTPADVYTRRGRTILLGREKTKRRTMNCGACSPSEPLLEMKPDELNLLSIRQPPVSRYLMMDSGLVAVRAN